ncbi:MAG: Mur ligase family protein [Chlamydiales bacterium]|nr:Mur ligase family protein [Chlamydiales bacterium]
MGRRIDICQTSRSFDELVDFIFSFKRAEKSGLEAMRCLDEAQGYLHRQFRSIHVTGTNGKGSVCHKMALALQKEGLKVGLYTSPHIVSFCERIRINGEMIPKEAVERLLPLILSMGLGSFFDYTTALAFAYFAQEQIDIAVIEVGIGGRFDSTNVICPILSVITTIDYDHMHLLGNTLEEIAYEKAGIIKPGVPYLLGPRVPFLEGPRAPAAQSEFYDEENSLIAKKALEMLNVSTSSIKEGITSRPSCRFEVISESFVLDVAHNPDAIAKLITAAHLHFPNKKLHFMAGFSADKDVASCLQQLSQAGTVTCVGGAHPRLLSAEQLVNLANQLSLSVSSMPRIKVSSVNDVLIICGSFYLMAEARQSIRDWELGSD